MAMALAGATSAAGPGVARSTTPTAASGHVRAAGPAVVKQIGARNYAGPNCPGVSWNCTNSTRVLQASSPGGQNVAECIGAGAVPGGTLVNPTCVITQTGSSNVAKCTQKSADPSSTQSCVITQTGASNSATVAQSISQTTTDTQTGTQTASVTQGPGAGDTVSNVLKVSQTANQSTKTGTTQIQNAYQSAIVLQTAAGAGYNQSDISQSQLQKASGGSTQRQDADAGGTDCASGGPSAPDACANVAQSSAGGANTNRLNQSINQDANTAASAATQVQGSSNGGLDGKVHQETVSGSSQNEAKQDKHQKVNGPSDASQTQHDPVRCCGTASQVGGTGNTEDINQSSSLGASNPNAFQRSTLTGESRSPDGSCMINQHASIDSGSANNSESLSPCPFLTLTTSCTSGSTDSIDAVFRGDNCTALPPVTGEPDSALTLGVRNVTDGGTAYTTSTDGGQNDVIEYQITYTNSGAAPANSVVVTAPIPAHTGAPVNLSCPVAVSCAVTFTAGVPTGITWSVGTVAAGSTVSATFDVTVKVGGCDTRTIAATVDTDEEAPVPSNDATLVLFPCIG